MASGEKLPKTNLNLIQDSDLIDHADINAIAQAVEANSASIGDLNSPLIYRGRLEDISKANTKPSGFYSLTEGTLNNPGLYPFAPVLVLRRFGNSGHALVIGCKNANTTEVMCHIVSGT